MTVRSLAAALTLAAVASPASAQISSNPKVLAPFKSVVAKANESTVRVRGDDKDIALGTVVFADGYIVSKASELRGALSVRLFDGTEYEATVVGRHRDTDLALLRVDVKDLKPVTFADSKKAITGHWLAASSPHSDPIAVGIVSVGTRQTPPNPADPDTMVINYGGGFVGIILAESDPKDSDGKVTGAKVNEVSKGGAGEKAGLKADDVITAVNGVKVAGRAKLLDALYVSRPGDTVTATVLRGGEEKTLTVKLAPYAKPKFQERSDFQNAMGSDLSGRRTGFPAILQTDMVLEPKNMGGPVVDLDGNILGISIARAGRVETWILPGEQIRPLLEDMKAGKYAPVSIPAAVPDKNGKPDAKR